MKARILLVTLTLILSGAVAHGGNRTNGGKNGVETTRTISKTFKVNKTDKLVIDSKYGDITIKCWDKAEVEFNILLSATAKTTSESERQLERLDVNLTQSGSQIKAVTSIGSGSCKNCGFSIDYQVHMPTEMAMDIVQKFGDVTLDAVTGAVKIDLQYGDLDATSLNNKSNNISIAFGDGYVSNAGSIDLNIKYSNVTLKTVDNLKAESQFSTLKLGTVNTIKVGTSKYDNWKVEKVNTFTLSSAFSDIRVEKLESKFSNTSCKYGNIRIDEVGNNFSEIEIQGSFTPITLNMSPNSSYNLEADAGRFGSISITTPSNNFTGNKIVSQVGKNKEEGASKVKVSTTYSDIKIRTIK